MAASDCGDNGILVSLQIVPQEMAENCFWIKVKEEKFENPDLFAQLSLSFSSQSKGKEASSLFNLSLINPPTRFIYPHLQGMPSRFHRVTLKETVFLAEMLIILKPLHLNTICVFSQFTSLCQLGRLWPLLQSVCVCVFGKASNSMWMLLIVLLCNRWVVSDQCFCVPMWVCTNSTCTH